MQTLEKSNVEKTELFITKTILTTYQQHCLNIYNRSNWDNSLIYGNPHNKSRAAYKIDKKPTSSCVLNIQTGERWSMHSLQNGIPVDITKKGVFSSF